MSHVASVELVVNDLDALEEACTQLGLELVRNQTKYKWWGHSVGDYPLPKGFTANDLGKCEHAIRIPNNKNAYEIGVVKNKDGSPGYQLLWDFYAGGFGMQEKVGEDGYKLKDHYGASVTKKQLKKQGYRITQQITTDGRILVKAR